MDIIIEYSVELKMKYSSLLTFVGSHDPYGTEDGQFGPVLSLLNERQYDEVNLIWTDTSFFEKSKMIEEAMRELGSTAKFRYHPFELESVIDYEEIFSKLRTLTANIKDTPSSFNADYSILLDPGTPQMQTSWLLLVKAGIFNAKLLQGVPARFTGGRYMVREVDLESQVLPEVKLHNVEEPRVLFQSAPVEIPAFPSDIIVSEDSKLKDIFNMAAYSAEYDEPVLIEGATGTGKEVLARFINKNGARSNEAFVPVNCAAINPELAESTLFGHVKGAYTGAISSRPGYFKTADGGTIFLDEIGELPLEIQPKLLRVLDYGAFQPVGSDKTIKVDVKLITATNRNLEDMVNDGLFREDLYQRINVLKFTIPPLQERPEDIPLLIEFFISKWNTTYGKIRELSPEALSMLTDYNWPRNVREVKSVIERLCCLTREDEISADLLPPEILKYFNRKSMHSDMLIPLPEEGLNLRTLLNSIEAHYYREAMKRTNGNAAEAAKLLEITAPAFRKALRDRIDINS